MIRKIITIDEEKCNGCGLCASACHEGAIGMVEGKAKLLREDYCDGLGDCLPACPVNAISFEEREAPAYNEAAVLAAKKAKQAPASCSCPGSISRHLKVADTAPAESFVSSQLCNFPVQIKLAAVNAPFFDNAHLLIAADCTAYACGNFHNQFMKNRVTLIGCPKLDSANYAEKLTYILAENNIQSVTVVRMEVPCCGGLSQAVQTAINSCGKDIPCQIITIATNGTVLG